MAYVPMSERYADEVLTNNAALNHYAQCKTCLFRNKVIVNGTEYGYDKCICQIYSEPENKPDEIELNQARCEFYEKAP